jgi:hypothetical protein
MIHALWDLYLDYLSLLGCDTFDTSKHGVTTEDLSFQQEVDRHARHFATWNLWSSGLLHGFVWYLFTDVSGQRIGPTLKGQEAE